MSESYATILNPTKINAYLNGEASFIAGLKPSEAVKLPAQQVIYILEKRLGYNFYPAFNPEKTIDSPLLNPPFGGQEGLEGTWLKKVRMVGINVRTIQSFWNVVKYALTLPRNQDCVHLLPIWEPGVVASLYGMSSWNINSEFFSEELHQAMPHLDTVEKQLKVVVNILHGLGKTVGMDVIPHTDRYSEQAIANPQCYEWLQRVDTQIIRHDDNLHEYVQDLIFEYLLVRTPQLLPASKELFFSKNFPESERLKIIFGESNDYETRLTARENLIQYLYEHFLETVPATMGPPYRGITVDTEGALITDQSGRTWRDYKITKPQKFSRVFGPLARYKLYENKDNNANWEIDFSKPIRDNWEYPARHYAEVQRKYNFDFMRGDMAHVQMRAEGVPKKADDYYDLLGFIKKYIQINNHVPYFGSFAETFLAPPDEMGYGDEVAHLELSLADTTLGDLQSMVVGSPRFMSEFSRYLEIAHHRQVTPSFTIMTADKDDPRFDIFYLKGNEARLFIGLFLNDMPSYMGLGFELRDPHPKPVRNEFYTKLYVFQIDEGDKKTEGEYIWGKNEALFTRLNAMRVYADKIYEDIKNAETIWLIKPNQRWKKKMVAWVLKGIKNYLCVVNLNMDKTVEEIELPYPPQLEGNFDTLKFEYSTHLNTHNDLIINNLKINIENIQAGEGRIYLLS